jgi:flagellar motor switch protein FliN/FliY
MDMESVSNGNDNTAQSQGPSLDLLKDIELPVTLRFGSAQMSLRDLVALNTGAVIELDRALADPVEVLVGGYVIAHGEPVVVNGVYGVRISEISSRQERLMTTSIPAPTSGGNRE